MKAKEIREILGANTVLEQELDIEIYTACGADLMSDVLAFSREKALLLTGLTNPQVIRTAEIMDIRVIVFVRGKQPPVETIELACEHNINLYVTDRPLFESCGLLYARGLKPEKIETWGN